MSNLARTSKTSIAKLTRSRDNALAKVRALQDKDQQSLSPMEMTSYVGLGAVLAALVRRYAPAEQQRQIRMLGGGGAIAYGTTQDTPQAVAIGLGMTASMIESGVYDALSRQAAPHPATAAPQLIAPAPEPVAHAPAQQYAPAPVAGAGG